MEGERAVERIQVLRLPRGDEAIRAMFAALIQDGQAGTQVRVETLRRSNKKGASKHVWSTAVLDQAACLVSLLSLDDPLHRAKIAAADGAEIRVADSTPVPVRSRHFFFKREQSYPRCLSGHPRWGALDHGRGFRDSRRGALSRRS